MKDIRLKLKTNIYLLGMTREEQIDKEAEYRYNVRHPFGDIAEASFIEGAKWADQTMIEKACDWIQMNGHKYMHAIGGCMYFDVINSKNDFKKAMEE